MRCFGGEIVVFSMRISSGKLVICNTKWDRPYFIHKAFVKHLYTCYSTGVFVSVISALHDFGLFLTFLEVISVCVCFAVLTNHTEKNEEIKVFNPKPSWKVQ